MTAGLQVRNNAGVLQVDETYVNYVLVASGTSSGATLWYAGGGSNPPAVYYTDITVTGRTAPMIAIRAGFGVVVLRATVSGGTWTWRILRNGTSNFDWFVFDLASVESAATFGLEVFNASAQRVYHSSQKPLRVAGEFGYGDGDGFAIDSVPPVYLTAGRSYAIVHLSMGSGQWLQEEPGDQRASWYSGFEAGSGYIRYARVLYAYSSGFTSGTVDEAVFASGLAVDVTNY